MKAGRSLYISIAALVLLAAVAGIVYTAKGEATAPPIGFTDNLTGPTAPQFAIPFEAFSLTPEGLLRAKSVTGRAFGDDRWVVRTVSGAYLSRDFIFEIDVTIPADSHDLAYVGFGAGDPNPVYNREPSGAFIFRIHNLPGVDRVDVAAARPPAEGRTREAGPDVYAFVKAIGSYAPGTRTTFRIERAGNQVTLSMPAASGASHTFQLTEYPGLFEEGRAHLFFANSVEGTLFSNARVRPRG